MKVVLSDKFWANVDRSQFSPGGCWEWLAGKTSGYGEFRFDGKSQRVNRLVFLAAGGRFTKRKPFACHRCNNRACVNLVHIYAGSSKDNVADQLRAGTFMALLKTHCPHGHPLSGKNLLPNALKRGFRSCLTCNKRVQKTYKIKTGIFKGVGRGRKGNRCLR